MLLIVLHRRYVEAILVDHLKNLVWVSFLELLKEKTDELSVGLWLRGLVGLLRGLDVLRGLLCRLGLGWLGFSWGHLNILLFCRDSWCLYWLLDLLLLVILLKIRLMLEAVSHLLLRVHCCSEEAEV